MKSTSIYKFAIPALGSYQLPVSGSYFRLMTATGSDALEVQGDTFGSIYPIYPGQGLHGQPFKRLNIVNRTSEITTGSILVSDGLFVDDRIVGDVNVINNDKTRTKNNQSFLSYCQQSMVATGYANIQIFNPVSSPVDVYITSIDTFTPDNALGGFSAEVHNLPLTNLFKNATSKKISKNNQVNGFAELRYQPTPNIIGGSWKSHLFTSNKGQKIDWKEPLMLEPGCGLVIYNNTVGESTGAIFETFEELR